jgi:GTP-binding protein
MTAPRPLPVDIVQAEFVGAIARPEDEQTLAVTGAEVAFAGRSNVGKSSLINTLASRRGLVRVSATPGCTRQINFFQARARDDLNLVLVDLPGYGFAKRSKAERGEWAALIERYLEKRGQLRSLVLLVDSRRGLEEDDLELVKFVHAARRSRPIGLVLVATKIDKLQASKRAAVLRDLRKGLGGDLPAVGFSSVTREGYEECWRAIRKTSGFTRAAEVTDLGGVSANEEPAP